VNINYAAKGLRRLKRKRKLLSSTTKRPCVGWDPNWWRWVRAYHFLNHTTQFGRDSVINMIPNMTMAANKW
jgi:hypothetical protein